MADSTISSAITLRENVPLNDADAELTENWIEDEKQVFNWTAWSMLIVMVGVIVITKVSVDGRAALILALAYFGPLLMVRFFINKGIDNCKQDISNGKSILTSTLIEKHDGKYGASFTFAAPDNGKKIRIWVNYAEYKKYQKGTRLRVSFLPFNKLALQITEVAEA